MNKQSFVLGLMEIQTGRNERHTAFIAALMVFFAFLFASTAVHAANNVFFWNKLGSNYEVTHSETGPNGEITQGNPPITYSPLQFGNGIHTYGNSSSGAWVKFLFDKPNSLGDKGALAFWVRPDHGSDDGGIRRWLNGPGGWVLESIGVAGITLLITTCVRPLVVV
jgi:hypothetical protein